MKAREFFGWVVAVLFLVSVFTRGIIAFAYDILGN